MKYLILILVSLVFIDSIHAEGDSIQFKTMLWYSGIRKFPYDSIPLGAYQNAVDQKKSIRQQAGMFAGGNNPWLPLGPSPGVYNGYTAGRCQSVLFNTLEDPTGNTVYLVAANGGMWKTTNFWDTSPEDVVWQPLTWNSDVVEVLASGNFCIDPNDLTGKTIFYGTGEDLSYTTQYLGTGVYKSTNGGVNWIKCAGLPSATKVFKIVVRPGYPNEVIVALGNQYFQNGTVNCGMYRSTDGGVNFNIISGTENLECTDIVFDPNDNTRAYCAGPPNPGWEVVHGTDYRVSTDGGASFQRDPVLNLNQRSLISICKANSDIIYVLTVSTNGGNLIYKSVNRGLSYSYMCNVNNPYPDFSSFIRVSPVNPDVVYVGSYDLYKSVNGGSTFTSITGSHVDFHNMDFFVSGIQDSKIAITCDGGIWRSSDSGSNFENLNKTLNTFEFHEIGCDPYDPSKMLGASIDNGLQFRNYGTNYWSWRADGDYVSIVFNITKPDNFIGIVNTNGSSSTPMYSTDGGLSYNFSTGLIFEQQKPWFPPLVSHPYEPGVFLSANTSLYRSENNGQTWSSYGQDIDAKPINQLAVSESNPNIMYSTAYNFQIRRWWDSYQRLYRTMDGGETWQWIEVLGIGMPNRYITKIEIDPLKENEVVLCMSGFQIAGHVFKSTNYGYNWANISENLGDIPVNDVIINYSDCNDIPTYYIATDVGVFASSNNGGSWQEVGGTGSSSLPNTTCWNLQLHRFSNKLRVGTFGIGAWETQLNGDIYVKDKLTLAGTQATNFTTEVTRDLIICSGGKLTIPYGCTVKMATGKKIIVESGGTIEAGTGAAITITSQSGTWGGIEFQGTGNGTLSNVTFQNTATPIVAVSDGGGDVEHPDILIDNCYFNNAPVQITNRPNVTVQNSVFQYSSGNEPTVLGVITSGSDNVDINGNRITSSASISSAGISVIYGTGVSVRNNIIQNMGVGISLSNSDAFVESNTVSATDEPGENIGIGADNSNSGAINSNYVSNYYYGIKLLSSSPTMLSNNIVSAISSSYGVYCNTSSSPRLKPVIDNNEVIWDAGMNIIANTNNVAFYSSDYSVPVLDLGCNTFVSDKLFLEITLTWPVSIPPDFYHIEGNNWIEEFSEGKVRIDNDYIYLPFCNQQRGGGGLPSVILDNPEPPQPFVVDYGNGIYDTLNTSTSNNVLSADQSLYHQGIKKELSGDFIGAVELYKNVVSGYRDSLSAIGSLKRILKCNDRMNSDSSAYSQLRSYYLGLAAAYPNDTDFSYISRELATKCLVRSTKYPAAITEYENSISGSNDSLRILNAELNIIETYMLIPPPPGDAPGFTGRMVNLKPAGIMDGYRMLKEKLYRFRETHGSNVIPEKFSLSQNYPNPFNPLTKINFSLPNASKVTLKIYDILGRMVKELVNEFKDKGVYSVTFDGTGLASGVYFYTIEAGTFKETKKMVLVK